MTCVCVCAGLTKYVFTALPHTTKTHLFRDVLFTMYVCCICYDVRQQPSHTNIHVQVTHIYTLLRITFKVEIMSHLNLN